MRIRFRRQAWRREEDLMRNHVFIASRRNARWIIVSVLILIMAGYARAQAPPAVQEKPQTEEQKKKAAVALDGREATKEVKQAAEATARNLSGPSCARSRMKRGRRKPSVIGRQHQNCIGKQWNWQSKPTTRRPWPMLLLSTRRLLNGRQGGSQRGRLNLTKPQDRIAW